ncbi:hypothetical protein [uncultured Paraglaciecola sp.]|uniref:hypothetical protein n=1 Tax=uncultured Paraglaciecola sp. TaxID=1765024 RepID=UPI0025931010|nr:hypothetical protein [uncultured Paraglaciecola sp.]
MTIDAEKTGQELMRNALNELVADPTAKINKLRVVKKAGLSHGLLNKKSYATIKLDIESAQLTRELELRNRSKDEQIAELTLKLQKAESKVKESKYESQVGSDKSQKNVQGTLMAKLVEMYRYNDLLRAELAEKHNLDIDQETGEVISLKK